MGGFLLVIIGLFIIWIIASGRGPGLLAAYSAVKDYEPLK